MPNGQSCILTASTTFPTAHCGAEGSFLSTDYATFPLISTVTSGTDSPTTFAVGLNIMAPMIQINWRSEDLATFSQPVSSVTPDGTSTTTTSSGSTSAGTQSVSSPTGSGITPYSNPSTSISAGALSGAVIGGVVCLFAVAAAVFFLTKRRKTRGNVNEGGTKSAASGRKQGGYENLSELPSVERSLELPGYRDAGELSGYQGPVELSASPFTAHAARYKP